MSGYPRLEVSIPRKVSGDFFEEQVQKIAFWNWERRMRATQDDDWREARRCGDWLIRFNPDFTRTSAYYVWQKRVNATPLDDWREAEQEVGRMYEVEA